MREWFEHNINLINGNLTELSKVEILKDSLETYSKGLENFKKLKSTEFKPENPVTRNLIDVMCKLLRRVDEDFETGFCLQDSDIQEFIDNSKKPGRSIQSSVFKAVHDSNSGQSVS